jgi:hypothetical protein
MLNCKLIHPRLNQSKGRLQAAFVVIGAVRYAQVRRQVATSLNRY